MFRRYSESPDVAFDIAVNFSMIAAGIPFPYDEVARWSDIVFSPIASRPEYNTIRLLEACSRAGVNAISYPWLEWHGYHPGIAKGEFAGGSAWHYPRLVAMAEGIGRDAHYRSTGDLFEEQTTRANLERTTARLIQNEGLHDCTIRVSEFIVRNYQQRRLFLTPDHPARPLHNYLARELSAVLGIGIDPAFFASAVEPQHGLTIPIAPKVAEILGLEFGGADYQNHTSMFKNRVLDWREYAAISHGFGNGYSIHEAVSITAIKRQPIPSAELGPAGAVMLPEGSIMQARLLERSADGAHVRADISWLEPAALARIAGWGDAYLYRGHWKRNDGPDLKAAADAVLKLQGSPL